MRTDDIPSFAEDDYEPYGRPEPPTITPFEAVVMILFVIPLAAVISFIMGVSLLFNAGRLIPNRYWVFVAVAIAVMVYVLGSCSTAAVG